jgi:hypothetical protein
MRADRIDFRLVLLVVAKVILLIAMIFPINPKSLFGQTEKTPSIEFTAIAQTHVYNLASTHVPPEFLPTKSLSEKLTPVKQPAPKLETKALVSRGTLGKTATYQVLALAGPASGDVDLIPNLLDLTSEANLTRMQVPSTAVTTARTALTDVRFTHKDVKGLRLTDGIQAAATLLFAIGHSILQLTDS